MGAHYNIDNMYLLSGCMNAYKLFKVNIEH